MLKAAQKRKKKTRSTAEVFSANYFENLRVGTRAGTRTGPGTGNGTGTLKYFGTQNQNRNRT
jgi:hypothetical protein